MSNWYGAHISKVCKQSAIRAYYLVYRAMQLGLLEREFDCEECNAPDPDVGGSYHAHHKDYGKPLMVVWVCISCHKKIHLGKGKKEWGSLSPEEYNRLKTHLNNYARVIKDRKNGQHPEREHLLLTFVCSNRGWFPSLKGDGREKM